MLGVCYCGRRLGHKGSKTDTLTTRTDNLACKTDVSATRTDNSVSKTNVSATTTDNSVRMTDVLSTRTDNSVSKTNIYPRRQTNLWVRRILPTSSHVAVKGTGAWSMLHGDQLELLSRHVSKQQLFTCFGIIFSGPRSQNFDAVLSARIIQYTLKPGWPLALHVDWFSWGSFQNLRNLATFASKIPKTSQFWMRAFTLGATQRRP